MKDMNQGRYFIGQAIRESRESLGWSLETLANASGIRKDAISKIERGVFNVGADSIKKLTDAMGVKIQFKRVTTLSEFCELINSADEWMPLFNAIIEANGWIDEAGEDEWHICRDKDGHECYLDDDGKAQWR